MSTSTERLPVVLVHGIKGHSGNMQCLARHLRARGWTVHTPDLKPNWGQAGLDVLAGHLGDFVEAKIPHGERFHLLGFSMGGLISRYYLQRLGGLERVDQFITLSTPHRGSLWAWVLPNAAGRQMRPDSGFLRDLESDAERLREVEFTSVWTPLDLTIMPARSSHVAHGTCRTIWCAAHPLMIYDGRCLRLVSDILERPPSGGRAPTKPLALHTTPSPDLPRAAPDPPPATG